MTLYSILLYIIYTVPMEEQSQYFTRRMLTHTILVKVHNIRYISKNKAADLAQLEQFRTPYHADRI